MAKSLSLKFMLASGEERTFSIGSGFVKDAITAAEVETCMEAIVAAGGAFEDAPTQALKATLRDTTTTVLLDNETA